MYEVPPPVQSASQFFTRRSAPCRQNLTLAKGIVLRLQHAGEQLPELLLHPDVRQWAILMGTTKGRQGRRNESIVRGETFEEMDSLLARMLRIIEQFFRRKRQELKSLLRPTSRKENDERF